MNKYKNPIPNVEDVDTAKRFFISPIFSFEENLTLEEAAHGISQKIKENGGKIPMDWIKFAESTKIRSARK